MFENLRLKLIQMLNANKKPSSKFRFAQGRDMPGHVRDKRFEKNWPYNDEFGSSDPEKQDPKNHEFESVGMPGEMHCFHCNRPYMEHKDEG